MVNTKEANYHGIKTIYDELLLLKNNNDIIDLTRNVIYNDLDYDNYLKDVSIIHHANYNIHFGLGCLGVVTNGSVRDIPDSQPNFQMLAGMINPSHAWVNVIDWELTVNVHGMEVDHNDLVHADQHGSVVIPMANAADIITEAEKIMARERIVIEAAQTPGFNMVKLRSAWKGMSEIH